MIPSPTHIPILPLQRAARSMQTCVLLFHQDSTFPFTRSNSKKHRIFCGENLRLRRPFNANAKQTSSTRIGVGVGEPEQPKWDTNGNGTGQQHGLLQSLISFVPGSFSVEEVMNGKVVSDGDAEVRLPDGRTLFVPVLKDSAGNTFLDVRKVQPTTGICTYDPGFTSTASCRSSITYINGDSGTLLYRGYPIEELATEGDFTDCAYLLLFGKLPSVAESAEFEKEIKRHSLIHEQLIHFYRGFKHDAHPMAIMVGVVGALSAFYHQDLDLKDPAQRRRTAVRLIAKVPTMAAIAYKTAIGQPIIYPRNDLTYAGNILHSLFATPCEPFDVDPVLARALEVFLILHMDHEQNASTSTVRTAGSSQANPYACIASGIAALWGPAHGGANEAVLRMLEEIGTFENIPAFIDRAKDKSDPFRLMGFGHRVYKTIDPRAKVMKRMCHDVLAHKGVETDELLQIAMELEKIACQDEYFVKRGLYPNVDFYSGIVLRALGVPISMFTVLFAVARTVGWVAQWMEMASDPVPKITRPRQMYTGEMSRKYDSLLERENGVEPSENS